MRVGTRYSTGSYVVRRRASAVYKLAGRGTASVLKLHIRANETLKQDSKYAVIVVASHPAHAISWLVPSALAQGTRLLRCWEDSNSDHVYML